ncbi:hypothetical protein DFH09DRAFT_1278953 [Mycena vulgaris]|nr:hypothetical protein DFH09DRAFT_1278953 [Mycena vulgaris]
MAEAPPALDRTLDEPGPITPAESIPPVVNTRWFGATYTSETGSQTQNAGALPSPWGIKLYTRPYPPQMLFYTTSTPTTSSSTSSESCSSVSRESSIGSTGSLSSATKEALTVNAASAAKMGIMSTHPGILAAMLMLVMPHDDVHESEDQPRYTRRSVILSEAQELNPPALPPLTPVKVYRDALFRTARTLVLRPRRASAPLPRPTDLKSLSTAALPVTVYTSPIALPLPKGSAPPVASGLHRRASSMDPALCPGW